MNAPQPHPPTLKIASERPAPSLELGRPQRAVYDLMREGALRGDILDVGCGAGENALMLAAHGLTVTGVDDSPAALVRARKKAAERAVATSFVDADLLRLGQLGRAFDCALDVGTLHRFAPVERSAYARSLRCVLRPGARLYLLVFGEHERGHGGPRRITQQEIRAAFADGFHVESIADARFESLIFPGGANAWLATLTRL
jgi:cyclopropane fatty-acyl-phospholipid synthase-like methyltransferase